MKRSLRQVPIAALLGGMAILLISCQQAPVDYDRVSVIRVVDGDSFQIDTGEEVRMIGIDCPEMTDSDKFYRQAEGLHMDARKLREIAQKAAAFSSSLLYGKEVRLEFDAERHDKYDRLLAYVYLPDGAMVNELIMRRGYATLLFIPPNLKYRERLQEALEEAELNDQGLWGP